MLCSLAELGWDSSVTDRVALLDGSVGLRAGDSLDTRYVDWKLIVVPAEVPASAESPKALQNA